jgi:hypothetical protein
MTWWRRGSQSFSPERVFVIYISRTAIESPGRWSTAFGKFVAAQLAMESLKLNPGAKEDVERALKMAKPVSEGLDAVQNPPEFRRMGQWASAARGGRSSREQGR